MTTIYGLVDRREPTHIRYVGATVNLSRRMSQHRSRDKAIANRPVAKWASELGRHLDYVVLSVASRGFERIEEKFWISFLREQKHDILNENLEGGRGRSKAAMQHRNPGVHTPEHMAMMQHVRLN